MSLYVIAGPKLEACLLSKLTDALNRDEVVYTTDGVSKAFQDFTPVLVVQKLEQLSLLLADRYGKVSKRISIFLPNLSFDEVALLEFLDAASTSDKSSADVYIGMSDCSCISMFEKHDVVRINAGEVELCTWQYYQYTTRRDHNYAIYDYLIRHKEDPK